MNQDMSSPDHVRNDAHAWGCCVRWNICRLMAQAAPPQAQPIAPPIATSAKGKANQTCSYQNELYLWSLRNGRRRAHFPHQSKGQSSTTSGSRAKRAMSVLGVSPVRLKAMTRYSYSMWGTALTRQYSTSFVMPTVCQTALGELRRCRR
jgi:hypothetical protein